MIALAGFLGQSSVICPCCIRHDLRISKKLRSVRCTEQSITETDFGDADLFKGSDGAHALLIHLGQTDNECLKSGSGVSIPQSFELGFCHTCDGCKVGKRFASRSSSYFHFDQRLGECGTAHFGFDADRGQRRSKAQNLRFRKADLMTCSSQSHSHHHDGGLCCGEVVAQLNQRRAKVSEQALIHISYVRKLRQRRGCLGCHNIGGVAQIDHCTRECGQIIRTDAQLTGDGNDFCDIVRRSGDLGRHALDLIRQGGKLFLGSIDRFADGSECRLIRNGRLDRRRSQRQNRRGHYGGQSASNGSGYLAGLITVLAEGIQTLSGFRPGRLCGAKVFIGLLDFLPNLGKSSLCFVESSFSINDSIGCLLDLLWIMSILCRLQLFTGTAQSILILGDCVFLQGELLAEHGQFGSQAADTGVHILDADSRQLELALCKADLLAEGSDSRPALLNGLSGGIPIGLSQRQRTVALADFRLRRLHGSTGAIQIDVRL